MVTDQEYQVSGVPDPDTTGDYLPIGPYNGKPSYQRTPNGWFLWWDAIDSWIISSARGVKAPFFWQRTNPNIEGLYLPQAGALGNLTVTEI